MPTDQSSPARHSDWFLIALDGDMVIKLGGTLDIGEDDAGDLVLNPDPDRGLVRLTVTARELQVQILALEMTLRQAVHSSDAPSAQYLTFDRPESIRLNFPNNSLIVASEFTPGVHTSIQREIALVPTGTPTLVTERLREPIIVVEEPLRATEASDESLPDDIMELMEDPAEDPLHWQAGIDSDVPDESGDTAPGTAPADLPAGPIFLPESQSAEIQLPEHTGPHKSEAPAAAASSRRWPRIQPQLRWILIAATLIAAMMLPLQWADRELGILSSPAMDAVQSLLGSLSERRIEQVPEPAPEPADMSVTLDTGSGDRPSTGPELDPETGRTADPDPPEETVASQSSASPSPSLQRERQPDPPAVIETLLMEAQRLYSSGAIVAPVEYNAVQLLNRILYTDPTNEGALELMYLCATRLLNRARSARAGGNEYAARNIVEEVLGFHPEFDEAHQLLESWSQPDGQEVDSIDEGRQVPQDGP